MRTMDKEQALLNDWAAELLESKTFTADELT